MVQGINCHGGINQPRDSLGRKVTCAKHTGKNFNAPILSHNPLTIRDENWMAVWKFAPPDCPCWRVHARRSARTHPLALVVPWPSAGGGSWRTSPPTSVTLKISHCLHSHRNKQHRSNYWKKFILVPKLRQFYSCIVIPNSARYPNIPMSEHILDWQIILNQMYNFSSLF